MSHVVLLGLPDDLAAALEMVLQDQSHRVSFARSLQEVPSDQAEVAFISGDSAEFPGNISDLRDSAPHLPVVVVTRLPESSRWLDALEAGARDYCGAPFEHRQLQWIMDGICPAVRTATASAAA